MHTRLQGRNLTRGSGGPHAPTAPLVGRPAHGDDTVLAATTGQDFLNSHFSRAGGEADGQATATIRRAPLTNPSSVGGAGRVETELSVAAELERRTDEVNAIQRNFERLSEMHRRDREAADALAAENAAYLRELEGLRAERKLFAALRQEFASVKQQWKDTTEGARGRELELSATIQLAEDRERHLEERLDRTHSKLVDLQRRVFSQFAPRLRDVGLASAAIVEKLETLVGVSGVMGETDLSTSETLRTVMHRHQAAPTPLGDIDEECAFWSGGRPHFSTSDADACSPTTTDGGQPAGSPPPTGISTGLNTTFAVLAPEYAVGSEAEEEGGARTSSDSNVGNQSNNRKPSTDVLRISVAPLDPVRLSKKSADALISPPRHSRRLKLLATQFDTLFGALDMCEKEVVPCVVQFVRNATATHKAAKREISSLAARGDGLEKDKDALGRSNASLQAELAALRELLEKERREGAERLKAIVADRTLTAGKHGEELNVCRGELSSLQRNFEALQIELDKARKAGAEEGEAKRLATELQSQLDAARRSNADQQSVIESLRHDTAGLKKELQRALQTSAEHTDTAVVLRRDCLHATSALASARQECTRLTDIEVGLTAELQSLKVELDTARKAGAQEGEAKRLASELQSQLDAARRSNADQQSVIERLHEEVGELRLQVERAQQLNADQQKVSGQLRAEAGRVGSELAESQRLNSGHMVSIRNLQHNVETLQVELAAARKAGAEEGEAKRLASELQSQLDAARRSNADQQSAVDRLHEEVGALKKEVGGLQASLRDADAERRILQEQDGSRRKENEAARLQAAKLVDALRSIEEACESGYSCQSCLQVLVDPLICAPCGHCFCRKCLDDANSRSGVGKSARSTMYCPECDLAHVTMTFPSKQMDLLASKFEFRKRILKNLDGILGTLGRDPLTSPPSGM